LQIKSRAKKFSDILRRQIDFAFSEITSKKNPNQSAKGKTMKKYLLLLLPLLAACAGAPEVEIEKKIEYKCGEQIISADFLDDDSMIARVDGINYVLVRVAAADGRRYENTATGMTFMQNGNGTYLTIKGRNYPMCQEIVK
jgi:membrane-bound inhibitor of C-type lysozyme